MERSWDIITMIFMLTWVKHDEHEHVAILVASKGSKIFTSQRSAFASISSWWTRRNMSFWHSHRLTCNLFQQTETANHEPKQGLRNPKDIQTRIRITHSSSIYIVILIQSLYRGYVADTSQSENTHQTRPTNWGAHTFSSSDLLPFWQSWSWAGLHHETTFLFFDLAFEIDPLVLLAGCCHEKGKKGVEGRAVFAVAH